MLVVSSHSQHAWIIPGGGVESGETVVEAALREVEEEAGVRSRVIEMLGVIQASFTYKP